MTVKERHYWKFIKQILFLLNYILFIIKICQMCKIKSHWMFSVVFFMFYICVICDCVCVLKYAIYLIWPRQFSFGPDSSHLAHVFLIWLIPWPEQKMSQRGPWYAWANSADPDQTAPRGAVFHCLPFRLHRLDSLLYGRATFFWVSEYLGNLR